jgi:hypothetical protein
MTDRSDPRDPDNWPDEVRRSADAMVSVLSMFVGVTAMVPVETEDDDGSDPSVLPVGEWSLRNFAQHFARQCEQHGLPYVLKYQRDVQAMKQIRADLSSVGRGSNDDLKAFLDWTFSHHEMISEKRGHFTTGSIQAYVSHFLQTIPDETLPRPSWGSPLAENMLIEYRENGSLGLLIKFGIPLAAIFLGKVYPLDRVVLGIGSRLAKMVEARKLDDVCRVARQSIVSSPYLKQFPLLDWRDQYSEMWEVSGCRGQAWWRDEDYPGQPYIEYDGFVPESA